jgi:hypothetical protein
MGSLLAPHLEDVGIEFTFHDIGEERVQSWRASTGAIMPFGDEDSMQGLEDWRQMVRCKGTFRELYLPHIQRARFCYYSQNPPHGGAKFGVEEIAKVGGVRISNKHSFHIDAQQVVEIARSHYRKQRLAHRPSKKADDDLLIVTHGWRPNTIGAYSWGWSAIVTARMSDELQIALGFGEGCFYLRNGYQVCYLYPVGRTGAFYAGTTLVTQKNGPKDLDPEPHYRRWANQLENFSGGHLAVRELLPNTLRQAWRPKPRDDQSELVWRRGSTVYFRPAAGNGIRLFPLYLDALLAELGVR